MLFLSVRSRLCDAMAKKKSLKTGDNMGIYLLFSNFIIYSGVKTGSD